MFDNKDRFCHANEMQLNFAEETLKINRNDIMGMPMEQILACDPVSANTLIYEN